MITVYNRIEFLEGALSSVLQQDMGPELMQIEVIDDCSPEKTKIREIVDSIGKKRVLFHSNPSNLGMAMNWNTCIQRARGHWVHILHDDDLLQTGFYKCMKEGIESKKNIGAAFCRHIFLDEDENSKTLSALERKSAGVLEGWLEKIAVVQRIQCPSIIVRRDVYEKIGRFNADLTWSCDWEMWRRIAAHGYQFWYEPRPLACYRMHSYSYTTALKRGGENIADVRRSINIVRSYLPRTRADYLSNRANEWYAIYAINEARNMLLRHDLSGVFAQLREGIKCSLSWKVIRELVYFLIKSSVEILTKLIKKKIRQL